MDYPTLRELIDNFEAFEQETGKTDIPAFALWLKNKFHNRPNDPGAKITGPEQYGGYDVQISAALGTLYQHARHYTKTALRDLPLKGIHDFTFLAALHEFGDLRKSELIARNMLEYSPGMEVIRRLLRQELIEDYDDPEDARSRRVRLTAAGREVFQKALGQMSLAARIVGGNLQKEEKERLLVIGGKLMNFHRSIWENDLGESLESIMEKYLEGSPGNEVI